MPRFLLAGTLNLFIFISIYIIFLLTHSVPRGLISSAMWKVKISNLKLKSNDKINNMKGIPLVVKYYPLLKSISAIIDKNLSILHIDKDMKRVFTPRPVISFCSSHKLKSYLARQKLYPLEWTVGLCRCNSKRCQFYSNITKLIAVVMTKQILR